MTSLQRSLNDFCRWFDARAPRERLVLTISLLVVLTLLWYVQLIEPLALHRQALATQINSTTATVSALDQAAGAILAGAAQDPNAENRQQKVLLEEEIGRLDERLAALTGELISPQQMVAVLEEMLKRRRQLSLTRLENLPSEPMLESPLDPPPFDSQAEKVQQRNLYRHPLRIELTGNYLEVLAYLQSLEQLPRKVYWQDLALSVEEYPQAKITVTVYTLSLKEDWIGV
ncbi:MAG: type II secretion system protein M [Desulfuromonadaceae bacterium]|nr:type II secretion system protein M [Desulfuromonadaceae bacterium]